VLIGLAHGVLGVLVALVAVPLQVLFCITLARLVTTSMARLLRSRRGKDLAVFLFIPIFALIELLGQVIPNAAAGGITAASFAGVDAWMRWLPPGLAVHAIQDASTGRPGTALARLGLLAAVIIVLGWLWIRSLSRALVTADSSTGSSQLRGTALPLARYGLRGAVAARFWVYQRREPISLVYWAMTAVIMAVVSASAIFGPHQHPGVVIGSAVVGAGFVGYFHANSVGLTGPPFVVEALALTSRRSLRAYFSGQNLALGVIAVPLLTAISFGLAAAVRHPNQAVPATAVALAGLGAALGLSNILTVTLAYPMTTRTGSPMRQAAAGYASYTFGGMLASLAGVAVAVTPVILAAAFTSTAPAAVRTPALIICSAAYGLALAWAGVQIAAREAAARLPELCQIAVRSTA
jgi:ABC-2 type transport system permease protein